jgi:predicted hydrolase (HD superfamily)
LTAVPKKQIGSIIQINITKTQEEQDMLTLERAKELNATMVHEPHLIVHAESVMAAMGAMAKHFGEDEKHWKAIGYLHDYDYEKYPEEHLKHTEQPLLDAGLTQEEVRAIMAHGWGICSDVEPLTNCEKSLYTVDELTGIIGACARMRPNGITDLEISSFMKKFKDKRFAAKCNRELIKKGCEMLGMEVKDVAEICIEGMRPYAKELGFLGTEHTA